MTIPTGNPIWTRNAGITQYGGDINKVDYGGIGAINAHTDIAANQFLRITADLAGLARVSPLVRLMFTIAAIEPITTVNICSPAWGVPASWTDQAGYPGTIYPSVTGTGAFRTITLPPNAADDYGVIATINPQIVMAVGGVWNGVFSSNSFILTGLSNGTPVSVTIW